MLFAVFLYYAYAFPERQQLKHSRKLMIFYVCLVYATL